MTRRSAFLLLPLALAPALTLSCRSGERSAPLPGVLHLADALDRATVHSAAVPQRQPRSWTLDATQPPWGTVSHADRADLAVVTIAPLADAHRVTLARSPTPQHPFFIGGMRVDLAAAGAALALDDWDTVAVRARCSDRLAGITVAYNVDGGDGLPGFMQFLTSQDEAPPVFNDGSAQTYAIPLRRREGDQDRELRSLVVVVGAPGPGSIDILSVTLVPRGAGFDHASGARAVEREGTTRHSLYAHTPASLSWSLDGVPADRLDLGLAVNGGETVTYRVRVERGDERATLLEQTVSEGRAWQQRTVDLVRWKGDGARLTLEASSQRPGAVALWGAPILSRATSTERAATESGNRDASTPPNVIFYVIDGGGADLMSLYGYQRPTTPFLEKLAAEAVVFDRAFANATWTQPSTVSFMTSLQHSVLGGLRRGVHSTPVPTAAVTMAERFRRGGYQTAVFTSNPNCGRLVGLERGVDYLRDVETESHSTSSEELHDRFFRFRSEYPGGPWWVHFQTTDVHEPNEPVAPFKGRFVSEQQLAQLGQWEGQLWQAAGPLFGTTSVADFMDQGLVRSGVPRQGFFAARRGLYDETMLHQDRALERFVARLKEVGQWENTLLVIAADHGHPAGTFTRFGRGLLEPQPEPWQGGLFESYLTRVPLVVVWPGKLQGGRRVAEPVSMLDLLPTLLELAGLPEPEVKQGQSLAPLLRGERMRVRPVILDEFRVDEASGEMVGNLEIVDGRWGASLEIGPVPPGTPAGMGRHAIPAGGRWGAVHPFFPAVPRLLLYDLERDPLATRAVNDQHPELVEKYRRLLEGQWDAHRALAKRFTAAGEAALTPEQLRQLEALGYL